ncbi:MAG: hypothetical protein DRP56_07110 [Planctomycetota bacterium]|nr:MAG: hypothetical protein DRP56_07110 [Planctomycetota bacterium]
MPIVDLKTKAKAKTGCQYRDSVGLVRTVRAGDIVVFLPGMEMPDHFKVLRVLDAPAQDTIKGAKEKNQAAIDAFEADEPKEPEPEMDPRVIAREMVNCPDCGKLIKNSQQAKAGHKQFCKGNK